jgi:hypothetical protein
MTNMARRHPMITKWSHPSEFQSSIMVSRQLGTRRMSPANMRQARKNTLRVVFARTSPRAQASQSTGRVSPMATIGAPNMTIRPPILVLSKASKASGTRKSAPERAQSTNRNPSSPRIAMGCHGWK